MRVNRACGYRGCLAVRSYDPTLGMYASSSSITLSTPSPKSYYVYIYIYIYIYIYVCVYVMSCNVM